MTKSCPFCYAEIPDEALKCRFCGEWVEARAAPAPEPERYDGRDHDRGELGTAANRFVTFLIVGGIVVLITGLLFFFLFFLPQWKKIEKKVHEGPPRGLTISGVLVP